MIQDAIRIIWDYVEYVVSISLYRIIQDYIRIRSVFIGTHEDDDDDNDDDDL